MTQLYAEAQVPPGTGPNDPEQAKSWRFAKVLLESAREEARSKTSNFGEDWKFTLGENHWATPTSYRALLATRWQSRTVRNWLFATIDHKLAVLLDADPMIHVEPMNDQVDIIMRSQMSNIIRHELERLRWSDFIEDAGYDGAVCGKGLIHVRVKKDKLSAAQGLQFYELVLERVDLTRFYPDPSATRLSECRYVVYEPVLDMSTIREIFPERGHLVKPSITNDIYKFKDQSGYTRTDQDLIEGSSGSEYVYSKDGTLKSRRAEVSFIWIKDDELELDVRASLLKDQTPGFECQMCGNTYEPEETLPDFSQEGEIAGRICPDCGAPGMREVVLPAAQQMTTEASRKYPFGRMIAVSGDIMLYDGPNPHDIDSVFPFAEYCHYRVPRRFWGYGDTALLKSAQRVADKNMAQALDYLRLAANGPFEHPQEAEAYAGLGTQPGQLVPVPAPYCGLARWVTPTGFDRAMFQMVDAINMQDFQRVGGVSDVSTGIAPVPATSGVEVQARQRAASTRLGLHLKRLNDCRGQLANLVWQMMNQYYVGERIFMGDSVTPTQVMPTMMAPQVDPVSGEPVDPAMMGSLPPASNSRAIAADVSQLPRGIRVIITADPDDIERDKQMGQTTGALIQSGALLNPMIAPFLDIFLRGIGFNETWAREIQRRVELLQAQGVQAPPVAGVPPEEGGSSGTNAGGSLNADNAYNAEGV